MKRAALALSIVTCMALCSTAEDVHAQPPQGVPASEQARIERRPVRPNKWLLYTGSALVVATYIPAAVVAATSDRDGDDWLYLPVVGPWADLIDREGCAGDCEEEGLYKGLLVAAGVAQAVGVGTIVASFLVPENQTRIRVASDRAAAGVRFTPVAMGRGGYGIGVGGRF